jgi:hypothetical protein
LTVVLLALFQSGPLHAPRRAGKSVVPPLPNPLELGIAEASVLSLERTADPLVEPARSFAAIFGGDAAGTPLFWRVIQFLGQAAVLTLVGGALARLAAVSLVRFERPSVVESLSFVGSHAPALLGAPLSPFIGLASFALLGAAVGLCFKLSAPVGPILGGLLAFIPLLLALPMALLTIGQALGWPLMVATVAIEGEDAFDSLSRSYSYVFQRFFKLLILILLAWAIAALMFMIVALIVPFILAIAHRILALVAPSDTLTAFTTRPSAGATPGAAILDFWIQAVRVIASSWVYSAFWSAVVAIYLVLRRCVDGTSVEDATFDAPTAGQPWPASGSP